MKFREFSQLYRSFGFKVAFSSYCANTFHHPVAITRWKDKVFLDLLKTNCCDVIQKYKNLPESNPHESSGIIWSVWWQGEENAPETVKKCFASVRKHCGGHELKVITKDNFRDYIDVPEYILKKVDDGIITLTHFSDILRMGLLYKHGGLWLDATILVTETIPEEIFNAEYFSVKAVDDPYSLYASQRKWTGFLQAARKEGKLCGFSYEIMLEYWKTNESLFNYYFIDYTIALAYEEFLDVKKLIDALPLNNPAVENLQPLLNAPFDEKKFEELRSSTMFFKLTWKHKFEKNISGVPTFYGKIFEADS